MQKADGVYAEIMTDDEIIKKLQNRKIRMIALDLDDTTLSSHATLSERNRVILEHAAAAGIEVVIASGRSFASMAKVIPLFPFSRYAICNNGATITRIPEGENLVRHLLSRETVMAADEICRGEDVAYELYLNGQGYAAADYVADPSRFKKSKNAILYTQATRKPVEDIHAFMQTHADELQSFVVLCADAETEQRVYCRLSKLPGTYLTSAFGGMIELEHEACGKHRGVKYVADMLNIPMEQVISFGNADNDAEMLARSGVGVAVANASQSCMAAADLITDDYRDCGVARVLELYFKHSTDFAAASE